MPLWEPRIMYSHTVTPRMQLRINRAPVGEAQPAVGVKLQRKLHYQNSKQKSWGAATHASMSIHRRHPLVQQQCSLWEGVSPGEDS